MRKAYLFPFLSGVDQSIAYAGAIEQAKATSLPLVIFACLPTGSVDADLDDVYLQMLRWNGYYQTCINNWNSASDVPLKRVIRKGVFREQLRQYKKESGLNLLSLNYC